MPKSSSTNSIELGINTPTLVPGPTPRTGQTARARRSASSYNAVVGHAPRVDGRPPQRLWAISAARDEQVGESHDFLPVATASGRHFSTLARGLDHAEAGSSGR